MKKPPARWHGNDGKMKSAKRRISKTMKTVKFLFPLLLIGNELVSWAVLLIIAVIFVAWLAKEVDRHG